MLKTVGMWAVGTLMFACIAVAPATGFSTYRCGHKLVTVGDRKFEVEAKCGKPKSMDVITEVRIKTRYLNKTQFVEEWLYDIRYGWWDLLTFQGSRLVRIQAIKKE